MDSTPDVATTCDACPLHRGCPTFRSGRRACIIGLMPYTAGLTVLCALGALGSLAL